MDLTNDKLKRLERNTKNQPTSLKNPSAYDPRVSNVRAVKIAATASVTGGTLATVTWINSTDPLVERYEVWVKRSKYPSEIPYLGTTVAGSPANLVVLSPAAFKAVVYVRSAMKNGVVADLNICPTAAFATI